MEGEDAAALGEGVVRCWTVVVANRVHGEHLAQPHIVRQPPCIHCYDQALFATRQTAALRKFGKSLNHFFWPAYTDLGFDYDLHRATDLRHVYHGTPAITRGALRFLRAHKDRPFFFWLHYWGPHKPYVAPKPYRLPSLRGKRAPGAPTDGLFEGYLARTRFTDDQLGLVFAELKRLGLDKNTVVAVTSDHGEIFHRLHDEIISGDFRTGHNHGFTAFQEVLHVPLVLVGPGVVAGRRIARPVSQLDLGPTLLQLAGLPPLQGASARSLSRWWRPKTPPPDEPIDVHDPRIVDAIDRYWRKNVAIMVVLLAVWAVAGLGCGVLFADSLNRFRIGGFPLGFWFAQQGSILIFVLLILIYGLLLNRLDARHHEELQHLRGSRGDD